MKRYTKAEVLEASLGYFNGDELQADVFVNKYALRDKDEVYYELTPRDMHWRLAKEFARIEAKYPNPMTAEEIFPYLDRFSQIVPQGSPMFGIGNGFQDVSLSNCSVIAPPSDTISGIMETGRDMANLYKRRFGVGLDISTLRPDGASVSNSAMTSTGAWSFADLYSFITRMVGQRGRRGALMITMDCRHPDIEKFVTMKTDLMKVTGANVSVRVTDRFMIAVREDETFTLQWPVDVPIEQAKSVKIIKARDLFKLIAETACNSGEPGFLFWDQIKRNLPLDYYEGFDTISTNPCGELPLCAYDSCRLISIYLANFVKNPFTSLAYFDYEAFEKAVWVGQRLSDDLVDLELEKLERIRLKCDTQDERDLIAKFIAKCQEGRRTGLGTHGLGDTLARLCVRYDGPAALKIVDGIYGVLKELAYRSSIYMAKERGAFPAWDWEVEKDCSYLQDLPDMVKSDLRQYGRRNGALLTNAPTGSVSILSDNCSSGIEPVFRNSYKRRRKVDPSQENVVPDLIDASGDAWITYDVEHSNIKLYREVSGTTNADPLPDYFVTSDQIDWLQRVHVQAAISRHIDHSVSSTINLPTTAGAADVEAIYLEAWESGCKGITVYRAGSREAEVLSEADEDDEDLLDILDEGDDIMDIDVNDLSVNRGRDSYGRMRKATFTDSLGRDRKVYVYRGENDGGELVEVFVTDEFGGPEIHSYASAMARLISLLLKHGIDERKIAEKLKGLRGDSVSWTGGHYSSVPDFVGKFLEEESVFAILGGPTESPIPNEETRAAIEEARIVIRQQVTDPCPMCGEQLDRAGCMECKSCGWSKC